jgi:hypothetical protein
MAFYSSFGISLCPVNVLMPSSARIFDDATIKLNEKVFLTFRNQLNGPLVEKVDIWARFFNFL